MQLIDYDIDEATWGTAKKPYRYRWPEHVHDEVLARLLALNHKRPEAERLAGDAIASDASQPGKTTPAAKQDKQPRQRKQPAPDQPSARPKRKTARKPSAQAELSLLTPDSDD